MSAETRQTRLEAVQSLASTIRDKIVTPAAGKMDTINLEILDLHQKIAELEKEIAQIARAHSRTRMLSYLAVLGVTVLMAALLLPLFK